MSNLQLPGDCEIAWFTKVDTRYLISIEQYKGVSVAQLVKSLALTHETHMPGSKSNACVITYLKRPLIQLKKSAVGSVITSLHTPLSFLTTQLILQHKLTLFCG